MIDVLDLGDLVRVEIKHIQLIEVLQVPNPFYHVLAKHEDSECGHCVEVSDLLDLIVVEIQEDQAGKGN